jgi:hypothetical protein
MQHRRQWEELGVHPLFLMPKTQFAESSEQVCFSRTPEEKYCMFYKPTTHRRHPKLEKVEDNQ